MQHSTRFGLTFTIPLLICAVLASAAIENSPASGASLGVKIPLTLLNDTSARCLDGSPGGYYYIPAATPASSNKWLVYKMGGGVCTDGPSCLARSKTILGSSTMMEQEKPLVDFQGILSRNCTINPAFCDMNLVFLQYCDGWLYGGLRETAYPVNGTNLFFRGRQILYSTLDQLLVTTNFKQATDVTLSGCSAGGWATLLHANKVRDWIQTKVGPSVRVRAMPNSALMMTAMNINWQVFASDEKSIFAFNEMDVKESLNSDCVSALPPGAELDYCVKPFALVELLTMPTFFIMSKVDHAQIGCVLLGSTEGFTCFSADPSYLENKCGWETLQNCTTEQMGPILSFQKLFNLKIMESPAMRKPGNGYFVDSCLTHCTVGTDKGWSTTSIRGVEMNNAVLSWLESTGTDPALKHSYFDCDRTGPADCNPSCVDQGPW